MDIIKEEIKKQGEIVRQLKLEKAEKEKVQRDCFFLTLKCTFH